MDFEGNVSHRLLFTPVALNRWPANHMAQTHSSAGLSRAIFIIHTFTVAQVR